MNFDMGKKRIAIMIFYEYLAGQTQDELKSELNT